jgi:hypothetical protein
MLRIPFSWVPSASSEERRRELIGMARRSQKERRGELKIGAADAKERHGELRIGAANSRKSGVAKSQDR